MAREHSAVSLFVKYLLFFENFIIWIVGGCVAGLGAYILVLKGKVVKDPIDFFFDPSTLMCTAGAITVFITFIGWLGALREYTSLLRLYNWILTILFFGQVVLVIFVFVFYFVPNAKQQLGLFPEKTFQDAIEKYGVVHDEDMKDLIDGMQSELGCCGFSDTDVGFLNWNANPYYNCTENTKLNPESCSVPTSCCVINEGDMKNILCGRKVMTLDASGNPKESEDHKPIYKIGCLKKVGEFINEHALTIGGILLGILLPQMYFMYLSRTLRQQILVQKSKWNKLPTNAGQK